MTPFLAASTFAVFAVLHFVADFLLQPSWMAKEKSEKVHVLMHHVALHFFIFLIAGTAWGYGVAHQDISWGLQVATWNALLHAMIDWNVWRGYKGHMKRTKPADFKWWEDHFFYVTLGADQLLHGLSLVSAFMLATR